MLFRKKFWIRGVVEANDQLSFLRDDRDYGLVT